MACLRDGVRAVAREFWIERGRRRVRARSGAFEAASGDRSSGRGCERASRTRQRVVGCQSGQVARHAPWAAKKGWGHLRGLGSPAPRSSSTPRKLVSPAHHRSTPHLGQTAATRTWSYKRIRRALINRRGRLRYSRIVNRQRRNAMPLTKVERAADPLSRTSTARSTVNGTGAFRRCHIGNASARCACPAERMDCLRSGKRCKRNDDRTAGRILQRMFFFVRQDGLGFADCSSGFDPRWPAAPPRRGYLRLSSGGRAIR